MGRGQRFLVVYSSVLTVICGVMLFAAAERPQATSFDEITVHRINVVEPDGTLRMVISDHARLPGIIVHGKEQAFDRPQAGMIFYNDEGSENGGLIFGGHRNEKGEVVDSGGSLSFDKYDAKQIVQLAGVDDREDRFSGLIVGDSQTGGNSRRRVWLGRGDDGEATLALMDANGKKRIVLRVAADGAAKLEFLDGNGKVVQQVSPPKSDEAPLGR
jgi:hypothetical protein